MTEIGTEFVPWNEEEALNKQIRDINDDLQYLLDINKQVHSMVKSHGKNVDDIERKVADAQDNVQQGTDTLTSIKKSPYTYGLIGGLGLAALGGPILLVGAGMKAAIGGALGLGTVGAYSGSAYAKKQNEKMAEENRRDKERRLLEAEQKENDNYRELKKVQSHKGFQTKPIKRNNNRFFGWYGDNEEDDDEDIDDWDARN